MFPGNTVSDKLEGYFFINRFSRMICFCFNKFVYLFNANSKAMSKSGVSCSNFFCFSNWTKLLAAILSLVTRFYSKIT